MAYFIDAHGNYYEGDRQGSDQAVTQRPGPTYKWNGTAWAVDSTAAHHALQVAAQAALDATDLTCLRCYKAGVAFPAAWQTYTTELRAIVNGTDTTSTTLPSQPAYPAGT